MRVKVSKNKLAAPFRQAEFDIEFGKGISRAGCLLDLGVSYDIVSIPSAVLSRVARFVYRARARKAIRWLRTYCWSAPVAAG